MNKTALNLARATQDNIEALIVDRFEIGLKYRTALTEIDRKINNYMAQLSAALASIDQEEGK